MPDIPQSIIDQFFLNAGVNNLVIEDFGYTSQLAPHGDFNTYTGKELAIYRLAVLLSILEGSYINDPDLGVNLLKYIYKPLTDDIIDEIEIHIKNKIDKYEKDLSLLHIDVMTDSINKSIYFRLHLKYLPSKEDITLDFNFVKDIQALMVRAR